MSPSLCVFLLCDCCMDTKQAWESHIHGKRHLKNIKMNSVVEDSKEHFCKYNEATDATIKTDPNTNKSRGFGFSTFATEEAVDNVLRNVPHTVKGKQIDTKRAWMWHDIKKKIFVGGVDADCPASEIKAYFEKYGKVEHIAHPFDRQKNVRRQFCFVTFETEDACEASCKQSKQKIGNRMCDVEKFTTTPSFHGCGGAAGGWPVTRGGRGRGRGGRGAPRFRKRRWSHRDQFLFQQSYNQPSEIRFNKTIEADFMEKNELTPKKIESKCGRISPSSSSSASSAAASSSSTTMSSQGMARQPPNMTSDYYAMMTTEEKLGVLHQVSNNLTLSNNDEVTKLMRIIDTLIQVMLLHRIMVSRAKLQDVQEKTAVGEDDAMDNAHSMSTPAGPIYARSIWEPLDFDPPVPSPFHGGHYPLPYDFSEESKA